jgi:catechol 2,3-dioxygenase-like lactoylglutathione lyase family enzyme
MNTPFRQLHHICIVVHDIEQSEKYYTSIGIGPWGPFAALTDFSDLDVPNREAFHRLRYRVAELANFQLQLCQPPEVDCPQRRFLDSHGEGVFHIGFESDVDLAIEQATELGVEVLMRGQRPDRSGFVYFDTRPNAGVILEARRTPGI